MRDLRVFGVSRESGRVVVALAALAGLAGLACGQDVTNPGDAVTGFGGNWPGGEAPEFVIDNTGASKYLNFGEINTGFVVTPSGSGIVRGIAIVTANDAPDRDPTSYIVEGSDNGIDFTLIAQGPIVPSTFRFTSTQVLFSNNTEYAQYRVTFPTVRNPVGANSMQVGEVQLLRSGNVLTPGDPTVTTYTDGAFSNPGEGAPNLFDSRIGNKLGVFNGNLGPTTIDVTPSRGYSIVTGFAYYSANDDTGFPGRTPADLTLLGSNDGTNYSQVFTTALTQASANYQDQTYTFTNSQGYTRYRIVLGTSIDTFLQVGEIQLFGEVVPQPPANDACADAQTATAGTTAGSNFNATGTDTTPCGTDDSLDVWYSYTPANSGFVEANTFGLGTLDTTLAVYSGCGGALQGCDDNSRVQKSRVRWFADANQNYRIRVAGVDASAGTFSLTIDEAPEVHSDAPVPLAYNFNGMVHNGESGDADAPNGYRAISDRGLRATGQPGSIEVGLEGQSGLAYSVETRAGVLDIVQLGDRNTVDGGNWVFDTVIGNPDDGTGTINFIGVQPDWLPDTNNSVPQTTDTTGMNLAMGSETRIGVLYNASNGGQVFEFIIGFDNGESASVLLSAPDWFGDANPVPPDFGVESQVQQGLYLGASETDLGLPGTDLNVVEAVVSTASLIAGGQGDFTGRPIQSLTFANPARFQAGTAIYAATIRDGVSILACPADFNQDGGVDGADVEAFFVAWESGDSVSDVNQDGGVDGGDVEYFFVRWEAGGCL